MKKEVHLWGLVVDEIEEWGDREFEYTLLIRKADLEGADRLLTRYYQGTRRIFKFWPRKFDTHTAPIFENIPGITRF